MSHGWSYDSGDWWVTCDVCSRKTKASETRRRWDGYQVCKEDWETRQSLDFIRARIDKISVPFVRSIPPDIFVDVPYVVPISCVPETSVGLASVGTADCARADVVTYQPMPPSP